VARFVGAGLCVAIAVWARDLRNAKPMHRMKLYAIGRELAGLPLSVRDDGGEAAEGNAPPTCAPRRGVDHVRP
jgi:hypothetical protein